MEPRGPGGLGTGMGMGSKGWSSMKQRPGDEAPNWPCGLSTVT